MDTSRLRPGELLAAVGGALLLVSLVLDWYAVRAGPAPGRPSGGSLGRNAWEAFGILDVVLALAALGGIALVILNLVQRSPTLPVAAEVLATALALLALLAVVYRLIDKPGSVAGVEPGAYIGALATAVVFYGGFRALRDESPRGTPLPEVEVRPAPAAQSGVAQAADDAAAAERAARRREDEEAAAAARADDAIEPPATPAHDPVAAPAADPSAGRERR